MGKDPIRILQITDLHLFGDKNTGLLEIKTQETLQAVVDNIKIKYSKIKPDFVILSGDVSQDFSIASYEFAKNIMDDCFDCPIFAVPGNHDDPILFNGVFCNSKHISCFDKKIVCDNWRMILLNSHYAGSNAGILNEEEINFLQQELAADTNTSTLIFLHHQVLPIGCAWLDAIGLLNAATFLDIIAKYKNIRAVICGHVHQEFSATFNGINFLASPSTCLQFATNSNEFKLDSLMPGYRWFELYSDKTFKTEVVRIKHNERFVPDINNKTGY